MINVGVKQSSSEFLMWIVTHTHIIKANIWRESEIYEIREIVSDVN